ncbi:MAG: hypothetical protein ACE15F_19380 [bacterium]
MAARDPLWMCFPRWMEESGIPERIAAQSGAEGWLLFHKLVEIDCDLNLTPDWFVFRPADLARWTGVAVSRVEPLLGRLEREQWIERSELSQEIQKARIQVPLPITLDEEELQNRIRGAAAVGSRCFFRYWHDIAGLEKVERVIYLYQMLFGARFSPRIVEDLEEIANAAPMEVISELFTEAYQKKVKSLAWIKTRLHKPPESVSTTA